MIEDQKNTVIFDEVEIAPGKRAWFDRTFGKMEKDSLRSTVFLMMASTLGAGVYTLHGTFHEIGIVWAILLLVFGCVSSLLALDMYIHASRVSGDPENVGDINVHIFGKKFNIFATVVSGVFLYLIMISFTVCISKIVFQLIAGPIKQMTDINVDANSDSDFFFYHRPTCFIIAALGSLFIIPKTADLISRFSIACFFIHIYMICVIVGQSYSFFQQVKEKGHNKFNYIDTSFEKIFGNFGLAICTFNNVPNFIMARSLVKSPSTSRLRKIFNRANWIIMGIYILVALCGYLSIGQGEMPDLFFYRKTTAETDYLMDVGKFLLALSLIISFSLLGFALKMMVVPFIPGNNNVKHIAVTLVTTISVAAIAMNFKVVGSYINLAGSFGGTFIVIIFPALLALKSGYTKDRAFKFAIMAWLLIGIVSGGVSTYMAFMSIIKPPVVAA